MVQKYALIVEDQIVLRKALVACSELLFGKGVNVEAYGSLDFLAVADKPLRFDYAIIDPGLPGISVNNLSGRLKAVKTVVELLPTTCMKIVLTGNYSQEEGKKMLKLGADGYFDKLAVDLVDLAFELKRSRVDVIGP